MCAFEYLVNFFPKFLGKLVKFTLEKQDFPKEKLVKKANKICQRNYVHNNINEVEKIEIKKLYSQMASEFVHFQLSNLFCFLPLQKSPLYRVVPKIKFQNKILFFTTRFPFERIRVFYVQSQVN